MDHGIPASPLARLAVFALAFSAPASPRLLAASPPGPAVGERAMLVGRRPSFARPEADLGPVARDLRLERMILMLEPPPGAPERIARRLADLHDPASPRFHRWMTPDEFGEEFGPSSESVGRVLAWLEKNGFAIDEVARGRGWINFSGTAAQVESAFRAPIHRFRVDGRTHRANIAPPSVPREMAALIHGIVSLDDVRRRPMTTGRRPARISGFENPQYNQGFHHNLAPADFATIYDLGPLYGAGLDGTGQTIAVTGRTEINLDDVRFFRSFFALPPRDPEIIHNGPSPGNLGGNEETEADLDVQWSGAVAFGATVRFVISASTVTTDGIDLSAQYIVDHDVAPVMTTSFGLCEDLLGPAGVDFYNALWAQAAAEGITSVVSSGDSGAAGCDSTSASAGTGPGVNGLCSPPYAICVGGTQFLDDTNVSLYWAPQNDPSTHASALSYIPERAWDESTGGSRGLLATGGGPSNVFRKPSWQSGPGVPDDEFRDTPDVSLTAAVKNGYVLFQGHKSGTNGMVQVGGTSGSAPAFAGLIAIIDQREGEPQGNANTVLYRLGRDQYAQGGPAAFHDVIEGDNGVIGVPGFSCGAGYDLSTGLGSVDAAVLAESWNAAEANPPDFALAPDPSSRILEQGGMTSVEIRLSAFHGFADAVTLSASGLAPGTSAEFDRATLTAASPVATMTLSATANAHRGFSEVLVSGTSGATAHSVPFGLRVIGPVSPGVSTVALAGGSALLQGIAVGPDGNLWVAQFGANAIARVTPAGAVASFPVKTANAGPNEIARGPDGNLWFTEFLANKIGKITPGGDVTEFTVPTLASGPYAICAGPDGRLWFTESSKDKIGRITTSGQFSEFPLHQIGSLPNFIAPGPDGKIWFTEFATGRIGSIAPDGTIEEFDLPDPSAEPQGIVAGTSSDLWFTESAGKIGRITTDGTITEFSTPSGETLPNGIAAGPDGAFWFTESAAAQIGRIDGNGVITEFAVSNVDSQPYDIVAGPGNAIWFTEAATGSLGRYSLGGSPPPPPPGTPRGGVTPVPAPAPAAIGGRNP